MSKNVLVFRFQSLGFYSIENVFNTLFPIMDQVSKVVLPYPSDGFVNRLKNILFLLRRKDQIIHITGHDHYLLWWPFKNVILTIHDVESYKRKSGLKKWLFKVLWFDIPISNARIVTTISEFSKNEILSLKKYKTPIHVIPNPLTFSMEFMPKEFNRTKPRILHIGAKANKNLNRLIVALKGVTCELVIIGKISNQIKQELEANNIVYIALSGLTNEEVVEQYILCDLLCFVSTYEGFGLPILEAQTIGRPVLTSNCSSMPEIAGGGALKVNPFDVQEIRKGIMELIENDDLRKEIIKVGFENTKRYNKKEIVDDYLKLYKSLH